MGPDPLKGDAEGSAGGWVGRAAAGLGGGRFRSPRRGGCGCRLPDLFVGVNPDPWRFVRYPAVYAVGVDTADQVRCCVGAAATRGTKPNSWSPCALTRRSSGPRG